MKIIISIVIYKPDLNLLREAIAHFSLATAELKRQKECVVGLDIVNNNPQDDSLAHIGAWLSQKDIIGDLQVQLLNAPGNFGYGAGHNISIKASSDADYHLVSNPDVLVQADTLCKAIEFMESNLNTGLIVPKELGFDGELHHLCKLNPSLFDMFLRGFAPAPLKRLFAKRMDGFLMLERDYDQVIAPVYYPSGCFMFFRGDILRKIGGFDEWFFMYLEDADIGRRVLQHADVAYVPEVVILHQWTRGTHNNLYLRWVTVVSALKYWYKWGGIFVGTR
jgi:GT2 family glycosyltransferase